jgi:hypothetical protein
VKSSLPNWKNRLDYAALIRAERLRREKLIEDAVARKKRNIRKRHVPVAALEALEQRRMMEAGARRRWLVRKLVCPNVRGWPDLFVLDPVSKRCAFVEMKSVSGTAIVSKSQEATLAMLNACGIRAFVARGAADALKKLEEIFNA